MQAEIMEIRDWDCLKYCETRENCAAACGLEPPVKREK